MPGQRIGLVLGAGGLTGTAFHAGVLAGPAQAARWDAREAAVVVGTSAGSTTAMLLRSGLPPGDFVARMTGSAPSPEGAQVLRGLGPIRHAPAVGAPGRRPASPELLAALARRPWRYRPAHVAAALLPEGNREVLGSIGGLGGLFDQWPELPTWICAVSLSDGRRVVFGRDTRASVSDAVAASCAIPGYFAPVQIDGERFVDGGVWSVHSADLLIDEPLDLVVISAPMATDTLPALELGNLVRAPIRVRLDREVRAVRAAGTPVVVITPDRRVRSVMGTASMDPGRRAPVALAARSLVHELAEAGRLAPLVALGSGSGSR